MKIGRLALASLLAASALSAFPAFAGADEPTLARGFDQSVIDGVRKVRERMNAMVSVEVVSKTQFQIINVSPRMELLGLSDGPRAEFTPDGKRSGPYVYMGLTLRVDNKTDKKLIGVKGVLRVYKNKGVETARAEVDFAAPNFTVEPHATAYTNGDRFWDLSWSPNENTADDEALRTIQGKPFKDLAFVFRPQTFIFSDGSRIDAFPPK